MPKLLYLAQFAPKNGIPIPTQNAAEVFYSETYHQKIYDILKKYNFDFYSTNDVNELIEKHDEFDLVWSLYNRIGFRNCEIFVQSLCEYYRLPYIGAAPNIRALIEDKSMSKSLAEHLNIPTAKWAVASKEFPLSSIPPFRGPYFVKPRFGSGSHGIDESCICDTWKDVLNKANDYYFTNTEIIVEEFIDGVLYGVPFINSEDGSPIIATPYYHLSNKRGNLISNGQKRRTEPGMQSYVSHDKSINQTLIDMSIKYIKEIQPCDYARIDFIIERETNIPYFLEANAMMNLGIHAAVIQSFLDIGFKDYEDIILHILKIGFLKIK